MKRVRKVALRIKVLGALKDAGRIGITGSALRQKFGHDAVSCLHPEDLVYEEHYSDNTIKLYYCGK